MEGGLISSTVALSLVLFSPPSSSEQKKKRKAFSPSFYLSSHICEFACLLLALFCWCMYFVDKSSAVQLREISWVNSGKCQ